MIQKLHEILRIECLNTTSCEKIGEMFILPVKILIRQVNIFNTVLSEPQSLKKSRHVHNLQKRRFMKSLKAFIYSRQRDHSRKLSVKLKRFNVTMNRFH